MYFNLHFTVIFTSLYFRLISGITTNETGISSNEINPIWFPLPPGLDQSKPNEILGHVRDNVISEKLPFSHVYIFGDSACDTGNLFEMSNHKDPNPKFYWDGRFSNGPMWPDYLRAQFGLKMKNYAVGGATVLNSNYATGEGIPDFKDQVDKYLISSYRVPAPLAIIQFIGNDLISGTPADKVTKDIEDQLQRIYNFGEIKHFLIIETSIDGYVKQGFNRALNDMVNRFRSSHHAAIAAVGVIDKYVEMAGVPPPTADPGKWRYDLPCHNQFSGTICSDPQNYIYFDLYHPTTVPNYNIARYLAQNIRTLYRPTPPPVSRPCPQPHQLKATSHGTKLRSPIGNLHSFIRP